MNISNEKIAQVTILVMTILLITGGAAIIVSVATDHPYVTLFSAILWTLMCLHYYAIGYEDKKREKEKKPFELYGAFSWPIFVLLVYYSMFYLIVFFSYPGAVTASFIGVWFVFSGIYIFSKKHLLPYLKKNRTKTTMLFA